MILEAEHLWHAREKLIRCSGINVLSSARQEVRQGFDLLYILLCRNV